MVRAWTVVLAVGVASFALIGCGGARKVGAIHQSSALTAPVQLWRAPPRILVELALQGHPYYFFVDTGAARTFIRVGIARKLGLRDDGSPQKFGALGCTAFAQPVALGSWRLGNASLPASTVFAEKLLIPRAFKGVPVGGLLGSDFLSRYGSLTIDFTHRQLILGGKIPTGGRVDQIEVLRRAGAVVATTQVEVDSHGTRFIIDTGAPVSVIGAAAAARLGLRAVGPSTSSNGAVCRAAITPVRVHEWQIGSVRAREAIIGRVHVLLPEGQVGAGAIGVVGTATLARHGTLTIDFTHSRMLLGGRIH